MRIVPISNPPITEPHIQLLSQAPPQEVTSPTSPPPRLTPPSCQRLLSQKTPETSSVVLLLLLLTPHFPGIDQRDLQGCQPAPAASLGLPHGGPQPLGSALSLLRSCSASDLQPAKLPCLPLGCPGPACPPQQAWPSQCPLPGPLSLPLCLIICHPSPSGLHSHLPGAEQVTLRLACTKTPRSLLQASHHGCHFTFLGVALGFCLPSSLACKPPRAEMASCPLLWPWSSVSIKLKNIC